MACGPLLHSGPLLCANNDSVVWFWFQLLRCSWSPGASALPTGPAAGHELCNSENTLQVVCSIVLLPESGNKKATAADNAETKRFCQEALLPVNAWKSCKAVTLKRPALALAADCEATGRQQSRYLTNDAMKPCTPMHHDAHRAGYHAAPHMAPPTAP